MSLLTGGLHHLTIRTTDLARAKRFYVDTMGFEAVHERDGALVLNAHGTLFGFLGATPQTNTQDRFDSFRVRLDHLALAVENAESLDELKQQLDATGVRNNGVQDDSPTGARYIAFYDPDGIAWELYATPVPAERRAPANPLRDLASNSAYIRSVLQAIDGPIILVGHSYGGAVISNAAVGVPNVKALVFIAAFAPDKGESLLQLVTMNPGTQIGPATLDIRPYPLPVGGTGTDLYLKKSAFHDAFAGDLPLKVTDQMQAAQRAFSNEAFQSLSGEPAWKTIAWWYMVATQDHAIPPATERFMAARAHATVVEVSASHVAMISQPEATTRLILEAARSVR